MEGIPPPRNAFKRVWHRGFISDGEWFDGWWSYHPVDYPERLPIWEPLPVRRAWRWCEHDEVWYRPLVFNPNKMAIIGQKLSSHVSNMKKDKLSTIFYTLRKESAFTPIDAIARRLSVVHIL